MTFGQFLDDAGLTIEKWRTLDYNARRGYAMLFGPPGGARRMLIGDNEEYQGEARDRHVGFNTGA